MYGNNGQMYPQAVPQGPTNNNLWFGNNYSSGNSQASRSPMGNPMMPQNNMMQPMQNMAPQMSVQPQTMNNIIQPMGPEGAEKFLVGANSHVILMDSNRPVFYTKHSDDTGYAVTKAYAFSEIPLYPEQDQQTQDHTPQINIDEFVTKAELEKFKKDIEELVMNNA